jgi:hypothetical protein
MRTDEAVTAPVEPVLPVAVTQSPTARLVAAADWVLVYVVDEVRSRVMLVLAVEPLGVEPPAAEVPYTPRAPAETAVTLPLAKLVGVPDLPAGTLPVDPLAPPGRPNPPDGGRVVVQVPEADGWLMVTLRAVMVPPDDKPVATTQSPTATDEAAAVVDWLKLVADVQLTVTWPVC